MSEYGFGKVTLISTVVPMVLPISDDSNPGMYELDPISRYWPAAVPPSNATPATVPT